MEPKKVIIITSAIVIGILLNALILGRAIQRFKKEDRTISVKGFSEREVKSDFAVWTIKCRVAYNDLMDGSRAIEEVKDKVTTFLLKNGIKAEEVIQKDLIVSDKMAQDYANFNATNSFRYMIDRIIQVRSNEVDNLQKVSRMTDELLKAGVVLNNANEYEGAIRYYFTKLNEIKPVMLAEATKNAKSAAIQFTNESDTKLGKLKKANQGLFTIVDRDEALSNQSDGGYMTGVSDIYKKVRVVVSVEYSIE